MTINPIRLNIEYETQILLETFPYWPVCCIRKQVDADTFYILEIYDSIILYSLAKVSPTYFICSVVCAAFTLHRTSDLPSGAAGGRIKLT